MPNASSIKTLPFIVLSVIAFGLAVPNGASAQTPFYEAQRLVFSGDIDEGISQLKALAAEGDVDAMLELPYIH